MTSTFQIVVHRDGTFGYKIVHDFGGGNIRSEGPFGNYATRGQAESEAIAEKARRKAHQLGYEVIGTI